MKILFITQYFPPETGGPQNRALSLVKGLKERGHQVNVITEKPNYPQGVIWKDYKGRIFRRKLFENIPVIYSWIFQDTKKTFITRILFYLSFMVTSVLAALRIREKVDVVIATSPPLFVGIAGYLISRLKGTKYFFDVRDLWPDVAVAMGELQNTNIIYMAKKIEIFIYKKSDGITAVTESFCEDIRRQVNLEKKVKKITNGTTPELFKIRKPKEKLRRELEIPNKFIVSYVGNLGMAQGLSHIINAADYFNSVGDDVNFLIVGDGSFKESLIRLSNEYKLDNLIFIPRVDLNTAASYMAASDALLVPLGKNEIYKKFIPSKLFDSMASGRPILLSVAGESKKILNSASAGIYYEAENEDSLIESIKLLKNNPEKSKTMGKNAQKFAKKLYDRKLISIQFSKFIERVYNNY